MNKTEHSETLKATLEHWNTDLIGLQKRFGPGSFGNHEAVDRIHLCINNWYDFVADHPALVLDNDAWSKAHRIGDLMGELYQIFGMKEIIEENSPISLVHSTLYNKETGPAIGSVWGDKDYPADKNFTIKSVDIDDNKVKYEGHGWDHLDGFHECVQSGRYYLVGRKDGLES